MVGARSLAVLRARLHQRNNAVWIQSVTAVVVANGEAGLRRGLHERLSTGNDGRANGDAERTFGVVGIAVDHDVTAGCEAFALLEVGQDVVVTPARRTVGRPRVKIARVTSDVRLSLIHI